MPSPSLSQPKRESLTLSQPAKDLFRVIYQEQNKQKAEDDENIPKIKVNEIISKMSFFYEKIRNAVDYKDDHLLRKNAIERALRRLFLMGHHESEDVARMLMIELIRAGYLKNNTVPDTKVDEAAIIIERFIKLRNEIIEVEKLNRKDIEDLKVWIWNLAATNIEENLVNHSVDHVIGKHMFSFISNSIVEDEGDLEFARDKKIQIYLAIYTRLFHYDDLMLEFLLFRYFNPNWYRADHEDIKVIAGQYRELREVSVRQLSHPFRQQVQKIANRYTIYFSILRESIEENPEGTYEKIKNFTLHFSKLVSKICDRRYKESRGKLRRGAIRSIIYIFLTKTILVFVLEGPVILFLGESLDVVPLIINILFPPALLSLIVLFTALPGSENTEKIYKSIEEIVFEEKGQGHVVKLNYPVSPNFSTNLIFGFLYTVTFLISFGAVIWGLVFLHFHIISIIIFLFFLSLVSFFGIRLGRISRKWLVIEHKENIFSFIANFFYVPIISMGKWLTETFSQINVFIFILDFFIESPFKIFVEIAEKWTAYVKERKEGIVGQ